MDMGEWIARVVKNALNGIGIISAELVDKCLNEFDKI